jgi:hypothetical protein
VQIEFASPALVSIQSIPEQIALSFLDPSCFLSEKYSLPLNQSKSLIRNVPRQASNGVVQMSLTAQKTMKQATT